jgi:hypothetical protein
VDPSLGLLQLSLDSFECLSEMPNILINYWMACRKCTFWIYLGAKISEDFEGLYQIKDKIRLSHRLHDHVV